ncbi:MAG TPA: hypothetical protein VI935_07805 [Thermodesulfobacteriota bacterium]|nr:hypothetical protein [Thermodesulfobacteriota bacterium]
MWADLVKTHVFTLKAVVDAQAAKNWAQADSDIRTAASHMQMIADPLAEAIINQFPTKFAAK